MFHLRWFYSVFAVFLLFSAFSCSVLDGEGEEGGEVSAPRIVSHEIHGSGQSGGDNDLAVHLDFRSDCEGRVEFTRKSTDANGSRTDMIGEGYGTSDKFVDYGDGLDNNQLSFGRNYFYTATTHCNNGRVSEPSEEYTVSTPDLLPPQTAKVEWDSTEKVMRLSWTASELENPEYQVLRGVVQRDSYHTSSSVADYLSEPRYVDERVIPGEEYYYTIRVYSTKWGYSEESIKFEPGRVPIAAPQGVEASWSSQNPEGIQITWSPVAEVDSYLLYRSLNSAAASPLLIDTLERKHTNAYSAPDTAYFDTDVLWGNAYYYRVEAMNEEARSERSNFAEAIVGVAGSSPVPPDSGWVTQGLNMPNITLAWYYVPGVTSYRIMRLPASGGADPSDTSAYTQIAEFTEEDKAQLEYDYGTGNKEGRYVDYDVLTGTKYYYRIVSVGTFGSSDFSRIWEGWLGTLVSPAAPEGVRVSDGVYSDAVEVRWDAVGEASAYRVYKNETGDSFTNDDAVSGWITETVWVHDNTTAGLADGGYYTVQAMHEDGGVSTFPAALPGSVNPSGPSYAEGPIPSGPGDLAESGSSVTIHAAGEINLLANGNDFYLLLADADDADKRAKVMTASVSNMEWVNHSDYVSDSTVEGSELRGMYSGSLYLTYTSVVGGEDRISVKYWDNRWVNANAGALGSNSFVTTGAHFLPTVVWRTPNGGVIGSMFLNNGWTSSSYWADNFYSTNQLAVDNEGGSIPVVAEESGGPGVLDVVFHKKDGNWQSAYNTFSAPGTGMLDFYGLEVDASGTPFFAYHSWTSGGDMAGFDIATWDGSSWSSSGLAGVLEDVDIGIDIDMTEKPGSDIYAAVAYRTSEIRYFVQLWEYTSGTWQQLGPTVVEENAVADVEVVANSQGNPVLLYRMSADGEVRTRVYSP